VDNESNQHSAGNSFRHSINIEQATRFARLFQATSHHARLAILVLLAYYGREGLVAKETGVSEFCSELHMKRTALQEGLIVLRKESFITLLGGSRTQRYTLNTMGILNLLKATGNIFGLSAEFLYDAVKSTSIAGMNGGVLKDQTAEFAKIFSVFDCPTRLLVLSAIAHNTSLGHVTRNIKVNPNTEKELSRQELAKFVGIQDENLRRTLKFLVASGFVNRTKKGLSIYLSLNPAKVKNLLQTISIVFALGTFAA